MHRFHSLWSSSRRQSNSPVKLDVNAWLRKQGEEGCVCVCVCVCVRECAGGV